MLLHKKTSTNTKQFYNPHFEFWKQFQLRILANRKQRQQNGINLYKTGLLKSLESVYILSVSQNLFLKVYHNPLNGICNEY